MKPAELAKAQFQLARALWDSSKDHKRAVELARTAHSALTDARDLAPIDAWLATHAKP